MRIFTCLAASKKYLVVIAGPTAVGKTELAIRLAEQFKTVVVSADSRQVYKELSIGTAKPDETQLARVPHFLVGHRSISELYGAGHFAAEAYELLQKLFAEQDVVIMTGGSGLYIDALLDGVDEFPEVPIAEREALNNELQERGLFLLQEELKQKDPDYAQTVDLQNPQRVIRALEIIRHSGKPFSEALKGIRRNLFFVPIKIFVNLERDRLYARINARVEQMLQQGLLQEVQAMLPFKEHNALKTVGYKEYFDFLEGKTDVTSATALVKQHTRNYAKRQITWFKNRGHYQQMDIEDEAGILQYIRLQMQNA